MVRVHIWIRKKEGMTTEEFGKRWLDEHAPIARDGYAALRPRNASAGLRAAALGVRNDARTRRRALKRRAKTSFVE